MVKTYLYTQSNGKLARAPEGNRWAKTLSIFSGSKKRTLYDIQNLNEKKVELLKKVPISPTPDLNNKKENNK